MIKSYHMVTSLQLHLGQPLIAGKKELQTPVDVLSLVPDNLLSRAG